MFFFLVFEGVSCFFLVFEGFFLFFLAAFVGLLPNMVRVVLTLSTDRVNKESEAPEENFVNKEF